MKDLTSFETPQETRTEMVFARVLPEEKKLLIQKAKKYKISISAYIRLLIHHGKVNL